MSFPVCGGEPIMRRLKTIEERQAENALRKSSADLYVYPVVVKAAKENCRNCGAPHNGRECSYCGTNYGE